MPDRQTAPDQSRSISRLGVFLFMLSITAFLVAGLSPLSAIKRLDQPPAGTYRVVAGETSIIFLKLSLKSIKGLHRTNAVRGHLAVPGEPTPRPLSVNDTTSTNWESKIKIPQFLSAAPTPANIESHVVLLLDTRIPDDPVLVGRMLPLTFDLDMALPRVNPQDLKTGMVVPVKDSWTVQVQVMPHGYTRLYRRIGHIALIVAGVAMVLGFLRILLPGKTG